MNDTMIFLIVLAAILLLWCLLGIRKEKKCRGGIAAKDNLPEKEILFEEETTTIMFSHERRKKARKTDEEETDDRIPGQWRCPACEIINDNVAMVCRVCGMQRK